VQKALLICVCICACVCVSVCVLYRVSFYIRRIIPILHMHVTESKLRYVIECREVSFGVSLHVCRILRHKLRETRQS